MSEFIYSSPEDISQALQSDSGIRNLKRRHVQEMQQTGVLEAYEYSVDLILGSLSVEIVSLEESLQHGLTSDEIDLRMGFLSQLYPEDTTEILTIRMHRAVRSSLESNRFQYDKILSNRNSDGLLLPAYDAELRVDDKFDNEFGQIPKSFVLGKIDPTCGLEMFGTSIDLIQMVDKNTAEQWVSGPFTVDQVNMLIGHYDQQLGDGLFTDEAFRDVSSFGDVDGLLFREVANDLLSPSLFR